MVGDLHNHSLGYWRTFVVYDTEEYSDAFPLINYLQSNSIPFSFQVYGERPQERKHVSIRTHFSNIGDLEKFQKFVKKQKNLEIEERSYDESVWIKKAYELGTKIYSDFLESMRDINSMPSIDEFLLLAFHGFFNNLGFLYDAEAKFHLYAAQRALGEIFK
jgi:hypothetical protein